MTMLPVFFAILCSSALIEAKKTCYNSQHKKITCPSSSSGNNVTLLTGNKAKLAGVIVGAFIFLVFLLFGFCMLRKHWRARKSSNMVEKANLDSEMEKGTYDASDVTEEKRSHDEKAQLDAVPVVNYNPSPSLPTSAGVPIPELYNASSSTFPTTSQPSPPTQPVPAHLHNNLRLPQSLGAGSDGFPVPELYNEASQSTPPRYEASSSPPQASEKQLGSSITYYSQAPTINV